MKYKFPVFLFIWSLNITSVLAQSSRNPISITVPFLNISPDARSGALADAGVAISPDVNALFWNPSKLAFLEDKYSFALSYSPWMRNLDKDMNLAYAAAAYKLSKRNSIGLGLNYFNIGNVDIYDENLNSLGTFRPTEFAFETSFSRKMDNNFSLGLALKYIQSGINSSLLSEEGQQNKRLSTLAIGASLYYTKNVQQFGKNAVFSFGTYISNIGPKIKYSNNGFKEFLPTNLRIGAANTLHLDDNNKFTLTLDINKLLVPTPPRLDENGNIIKGKSAERSVASGIIGSFSDAPDGFSEELKEISFSPAVEYWYNNQFALRAGYSYENPDKGNKKYATFGVGYRYSQLDFAVSYLAAKQYNSALANTLRFSVALKLNDN